MGVVAVMSLLLQCILCPNTDWLISQLVLISHCFTNQQFHLWYEPNNSRSNTWSKMPELILFIRSQGTALWRLWCLFLIHIMKIDLVPQKKNPDFYLERYIFPPVIICGTCLSWEWSWFASKKWSLHFISYSVLVDKSRNSECLSSNKYSIKIFTSPVPRGLLFWGSNNLRTKWFARLCW